MLLAITGGKQVELTKNDKVWHKEKFEIEKIIESKIHTLSWDFESKLRKVKEIPCDTTEQWEKDTLGCSYGKSKQKKCKWQLARKRKRL